MVSKNNSTILVSLHCIADNEDEATGKIYKYLMLAYPTSEGFSRHNLVVNMVDPNLIKEVYAGY